MASVMQCDVCSNIIKYQEAVFVRINKVTSGGIIGQEIHRLDMCPECYAKLCVLLNVEAKE